MSTTALHFQQKRSKKRTPPFLGQFCGMQAGVCPVYSILISGKEAPIGSEQIGKLKKQRAEFSTPKGGGSCIQFPDNPTTF
jgi:hypothetical protein